MKIEMNWIEFIVSDYDTQSYTNKLQNEKCHGMQSNSVLDDVLIRYMNVLDAVVFVTVL